MEARRFQGLDIPHSPGHHCREVIPLSILRNPNRYRYTVIDSSALEDTAISFEAKGVLAYLLSKPDGWEIHQEHLSRVGGIGCHKMMRILSELRKAGYIPEARK